MSNALPQPQKVTENELELGAHTRTERNVCEGVQSVR